MSDSKFLLKWNVQKQTIADAIEDHRNQVTDVTLVCSDGKTFISNQISLSASSQFFYSILKDHSHNPIMIILPEASSTHFGSILSFVNTGEMTIEKDQMDEVLVLANHLQIKCLSIADLEPENQESFEPEFAADSAAPIEEIETSRAASPPQKRRIGKGGTRKHSRRFRSRSLSSRRRLASPNLRRRRSPEITRREISTEMDDGAEGAVIDESEYQRLKVKVLDNFIKEAGGWKCTLCDRRWDGDSINSRRYGKKHMECHLPVRFQCVGCGSILKTKESFYFHRSKNCKNVDECCAEPGFKLVIYPEAEKVNENVIADASLAELSVIIEDGMDREVMESVDNTVG